MTIKDALNRAVAAHKSGDFVTAEQLYTSIIRAAPHHSTANHNFGLLALQQGKFDIAIKFLKIAVESQPETKQFWLGYIEALQAVNMYIHIEQNKNLAERYGFVINPPRITQTINLEFGKEGNPPHEIINRLYKKYYAGDGLETTIQAEALFLQYPKSEKLYNIRGVLYTDLNKFPEAQYCFEQACHLHPHYAEAYYNNANLFSKLGSHEKAQTLYKSAINIKNNFFEAYLNLGIACQELGGIFEAISCYKKVLKIQPDQYAAIENYNSLAVQMNLKTITSELSKSERLKSLFIDKPKYFIQNAIRYALKGDPTNTSFFLKQFGKLSKKELGLLHEVDRKFCVGYHRFLTELSSKWGHKNKTAADNIYHIGESHCLSYTNQILKIKNRKYKIIPMITFGAKAFHFSSVKENQYKAITRYNLRSLPKKSLVLLSFGEIDCRIDEGIIPVSRKLNSPLETIINDTVKRYIEWIIKENQTLKHELIFINVPAPVYNHKILNSENLLRQKTVSMFNKHLARVTSNTGLYLLDVNAVSSDENYFSNHLHHVDEYHLGATALPAIEMQLETYFGGK